MRPFGQFLDGYYDTADQLREHLRHRADEALGWHNAVKAALSSKEDFARRTLGVQSEALRAIGGLPDLPAKVQGSVTGRLTGDDFTVEKLLIETLPDVYATANLYLPTGVGEKVPGVLFLCGHSEEAKASPRYQQVCRALVKAKMAVLALDPVGQGERMQYLDPETGEQRVRWGTVEHSHAGFQCHIAGFNIARYFVADAKQALTYLAARPEVDELRLGVTGNSGGGTQASYLTLLDERLLCSAPCTYITSRQAYMATGQAHDSEQNFYRAITMGLDYDDLLAPHVPKPLFIGAVASDFFCVEGTLQSYQHLRHAYELFERPENLTCVIAPGTHGYGPILRDRVTHFFRHHLLGENAEHRPGLITLAEAVESPHRGYSPIEIEEPGVFTAQALQVTETGQVALDYPSAKRVFDLNLEAWEQKTSESKKKTGAESVEVKVERLRRLVLGERTRPPMWVREVRTGVDEETGIAWAHRFAFSEPRIALPMLELRRADVNAGAGALAVVALEEGTEAVEARRDDVIEYVNKHGRVLLVDPRGVGAARQRPVNGRPSGTYDTTYKLNYDAMMLGDSLFAMRCFDVYRALEYARRIASEVAVTGEGDAGLVLLAAAVLDGNVRSAGFQGLLPSLEALVQEAYYEASHLLEVCGLLELPDVGEMLRQLE